VAWASTILLLSLCSVVFEVSSFFYWMSGSITYLLEFILFLFVIPVQLKRFGPTRPRVADFLISGLLIFCIVGCNEIAAYFVVLFLL
jgi:hypothetical protein